MSPATQKIFASTIGALGVAAGLILLAYGFSTVLTSTNAPANRDLIDTPAASDKSIADAQPPAFRVGLAVIPGAAKLPELATIGVHSSVLGLESPAASEVPEMIQTPLTAKSALDVALHPSLKYANWVSSAPIVRASNAAFDIPVVTLAATTVKVAKRPPSAAKPMVAASDDAETARLIALNLRMESARRFVTSMCEDHQGQLWVASDNQVPEEPEGCVECFDPSAPELHQWTQYTTKDGLGDNVASAIACDHQGRIWVGHAGNHGVSVFNGQTWQNYSNPGIPTGTSGLLGPLGERVAHMTVCPTDGDVWIATDCGLTRYSDSKGTWTTYGLPAGEATSFAFDKQGNVYVATEHDGIAMANVAENYRVWRRATAPDQTSPTQSGSGLPSNSINDILVAEDGTIYAATDAGLAWSKDDGGSWQFIRGRDWAENIRQQGGTPSPEAGQTQTGSVAMPSVVLGEDYCSCLAEAHNADTSAEQIYIGHRRSGVDLFGPARNRITEATSPIFARAFAGAGLTYVGSYGPRRDVPSPGTGGVIVLAMAANEPAAPRSTGDVRLAGLPSGAPPVGAQLLQPEIELGNLKNLYLAGRLEELLSRCGRAEHDERFSDRQPQLLYLEWVAERKLGNDMESGRLENIFLERYPREVFAADMYFEQAVCLLAGAQYQAADSKFAMIQNYFPHSKLAERAEQIRRQLKAPDATPLQ